MGIKDEFDIYKPLLKWEDVNEIVSNNHLLEWVNVEQLRNKCVNNGGVSIMELFDYLEIYTK